MPSPEPPQTGVLTLHPAAPDRLPLFRFADRDIVGAHLLAVRFAAARGGDPCSMDFPATGPWLQLWFLGGPTHAPTRTLCGAQAQALWDALAGYDQLLVRAGPYRLVRSEIALVRRVGDVIVTLTGGLSFNLSWSRDAGPGTAAEFLADWARGVPPVASRFLAAVARALEQQPPNDEVAHAPT